MFNMTKTVAEREQQSQKQERYGDQEFPGWSRPEQKVFRRNKPPKCPCVSWGGSWISYNMWNGGLGHWTQIFQERVISAV